MNPLSNPTQINPRIQLHNYKYDFGRISFIVPTKRSHTHNANFNIAPHKNTNFDIIRCEIYAISQKRFREYPGLQVVGAGFHIAGRGQAGPRSKKITKALEKILPGNTTDVSFCFILFYFRESLCFGLPLPEPWTTFFRTVLIIYFVFKIY